MKGYKTAWTVSLLVIVCVIIAYAGLRIAKIAVPDAVIRILGVLDLIAIFVLVYSTVKLRTEKKEKKTSDPK
ncbi:MAG: hypothetical protein II914_03500 [Clostridia bacterium]|nr:hypothetical protein [Clostridia bacterium]